MAHFPEAPEEMIRESDAWVYESRVAGLSDELNEHMLDTYYKGFTIYQNHLRGIAERVEEAGGVAEVRYRDDPLFERRNSPHKNELILNDGSTISLQELVVLPKLTEELSVPAGLPDTATRTHEIQLSFGGKYIGQNAEDVFDVDYRWFPGIENRPFDVVMNDPTYFPEDMGITERVVIDLNEPFDPGHRPQDPHVVKQSFSLDGKIWRPQFIFDDNADIPNPYTDPLSYRRWALAGDARLELEFQAPAMVRRRSNFTSEKITYRAMKTVIKHPGRINLENSESTTHEVLGQFQRYMEFMDLCYIEFVPDEERQIVNREVEQQQRSRHVALPAPKVPKKKKK